MKSSIDPVHLIVSADRDSEPSCLHHHHDVLLGDASTGVKLARGEDSCEGVCGVFISKGQKLGIKSL